MRRTHAVRSPATCEIANTARPPGAAWSDVGIASALASPNARRPRSAFAGDAALAEGDARPAEGLAAVTTRGAIEGDAHPPATAIAVEKSAIHRRAERTRAA
jgi:hypothetical protein